MTLDAYREFLLTRARLAFYEKHFPIVGFDAMPWQSGFIRSTAKITIGSGGNRSGKTEVGAWKMAALANGILGRFAPGFADDGTPARWLVSALDYRLSEVVKRKLEKYLGATVRRWYQADRMFSLHNGSEILIKSEESGEQKYQADDWAGAWKDEAGDAKADGIFNEILRGLTDSNGPVFITMTPTLGASWIGPRLHEPWNAIAQNESGREVEGVVFFFANTEDNIHLNRSGLKSFVSQQVTQAQRDVRLRGRFVVLEGLVYSMFEERRHVIAPKQIPAEWKKWRSMDWGLSAPSTCLFGAVEPAADGHPERLHIYREVYDTRMGKTIGMTSALINDASANEEFIQTLLDPACWNRDPAPESVGGFFVVADEYAKFGIYPEKYNNEVEAGVERIWSYLGDGSLPPRLIIHSCCTNLIREMKRQRWKRSMMGLSPSTGAGMGDKIEASDSDHALDPLRGMVMAGMLEGDSYWGPDKDPFSAQIEDAGTKYEWQLIDGKAVLTTTGGGGRSQDS